MTAEGVRSTGRVPGRLGGVARVVENHWEWYRRNWRATAVSTIVQPLLFLLAFGVGFGALVRGSGQAAAATGGADYLAWLAPGLLAMSAVQTGAFDSTYPVLSGFKWQRTYSAMTAGPITPGQVALGHLGWLAVKMAGAGLVFVAVIALLGGATGAGILVSVPIAVLTGVAVAAPITAYSATLETEGASFPAIFRFVVIPMTLFSGTFFPVDRLPELVRPLVWVSPLWHGTELARPVALGGPWPAWPAVVGHVVFLAALLAAGTALAVRTFTRRLAR
ncbi:ABC transporter permease [Pseudonocardia lacus]|uniref:ABC transporter permease n=1 Tax=Pseudonocardia lacus TaxID=2835865 RepID=UPI001BDCBD42|nr:ABC transporter permease [Pseudonocardia lacus]